MISYEERNKMVRRYSGLSTTVIDAVCDMYHYNQDIVERLLTCMNNHGVDFLTAAKMCNINEVSAVLPQDQVAHVIEYFDGASAEPKPNFITEEMVINAQGGKQHKIPRAFHRLDPSAMLWLGEILELGDSTYNKDGCAIGEENWRSIPQLDHINHALNHIFEWMYECQFGIDRTKPDAGEHLKHALCRIMFAATQQDSVASVADSKPRTELQQAIDMLQELSTSIAKLARP